MYFANGDVNYSHLNGSKPGFESVPDGTYHVKLVDMELKQSASGKPMIASVFSIISGAKQGRKVYANLILLNNNGDDKDRFFVHRCNQFLRSFQVNAEQVLFTTLNQYAQLVDSIRIGVAQSKGTYGLTISSSTNNKTGRSYTDYAITSGPFFSNQQEGANTAVPSATSQPPLPPALQLNGTPAQQIEQLNAFNAAGDNDPLPF